MSSIVKAKKDDFQTLADLGRTTLIKSHNESAAAEDLNAYVETNFAPNVVKEELLDAKSLYHLIYYDDKPAGYSKIVLECGTSEYQIKQRHQIRSFVFAQRILQSEVRLRAF